MPSPQRSGRPSSLLFVCFFGGCEKSWSAAVADTGLVGGDVGTLQKEGFCGGESYRELANKLASDRERSGREGGGGGGDGVGRGGDSFSQA